MLTIVSTLARNARSMLLCTSLVMFSFGVLPSETWGQSADSQTSCQGCDCCESASCTDAAATTNRNAEARNAGDRIAGDRIAGDRIAGDGNAASCKGCACCAELITEIPHQQWMSSIPFLNFVSKDAPSGVKKERNIHARRFIIAKKGAPLAFSFRFEKPGIDFPIDESETGAAQLTANERVMANSRQPCCANCQEMASLDSEQFHGVASRLIDKISHADIDETAAIELVSKALEENWAKSQKLNASKLLQLKSQYAKQNNEMHQMAFHVKQNQLALQFQQQLAPITHQQNRMQQMIIDLETRLLETQQTINKVQQQAKSNSPTIKFTDNTNGLPKDLNRDGVCDKCFHVISERGVSIAGHKIFTNAGPGCKCRNSPETKVHPTQNKPFQSNQPLPVRVTIPAEKPPIDGYLRRTYTAPVDQRLNADFHSRPAASQSLPTTQRKIYLPPPTFPHFPSTEPTWNQLRDRVRELERQLNDTSNRDTSIQRNPFPVAQAHFEYSAPHSSALTPSSAPASYPTAPPNPLKPRETRTTPLIPVPVSELPAVSNHFSSSFVPRDDKPTRHNWFSKTYYVGDILPNEMWGYSKNLGQSFEDYAEEVIAYLKLNIEPESWSNNEFARIHFSPSTLSLRIMQTHSNHQIISRLFEGVRESVSDDAVRSEFLNYTGAVKR